MHQQAALARSDKRITRHTKLSKHLPQRFASAYTRTLILPHNSTPPLYFSRHTSLLTLPPFRLPTSAFVIAGGGRKTPTTPPRRAPKRKLEETAEQSPAAIPSALVAEQPPARKASKTFHSPEAAALPATPLSSSSSKNEIENMDSDIEDFNSVASSDDFGENAGSSLGGGKLPL